MTSAALFLITAAVYAILSHIGELLLSPEGVSIFWPAAGFAAVMMLWAHGTGRCWVVVVGIIAGLGLNVLARPGFIPNEFGYLLGNIVEPAIMVPFLVRGTSAGKRLNRPASVGWLLGGAVVATSVSAVIVATLGVWSFDGNGDPGTWVTTWIVFAMGDLTGLLIVAPLMMQAVPPSRLWSRGSTTAQTVLWSALGVATFTADASPLWVVGGVVALVLMALLLDSSAASAGVLVYSGIVLWQWQVGHWISQPGTVDVRLVLVAVVVLVQSIALSTSQRREATEGQARALREAREAEEVLSAVVDAAPVGIALYEARQDDPHAGARFTLQFMNTHGIKESGLDLTSFDDAELADFYPDLVETGLYEHFVAAWVQQNTQEFVVDSQDSSTNWRGVYQNHVVPLTGGRIVAVWNDITEIVEAREEAEQNWTLLRRALDSGIDGFLVVEPSAAGWQIAFANRTVATRCGIPATDLVGHPLDAAIPTDVMSHVLLMLDRAQQSGVPQQQLLDLRTSFSAWRGELDILVNPAGGRRVVITLRDVTEVQASRRALETAHSQAVAAAQHDPLTGLANRILMLHRLGEALDEAAAAGTRVAVAFLDIDSFKAINDVHGHSLGDEVLIQLARRLRGCVRAGDTAARLGGDEFVVVLTGLPVPWDERTLSDRLRPVRHLEIDSRAVSLGINVSCGVAVSEPTSTPETLIAQADAAMYVSKAGGRGDFVMYHPGMEASGPV